MPEVAERTDRAQFLAGIEKAAALGGPEWLRELRESAATLFNGLEFPTHKDEAWRSTDIKPILTAEFAAVTGEPAGTVSANALNDPLVIDGLARIAFVDGIFSPRLSSLDSLPDGVTVRSLAAASEDASLENHLVAPITNAFNALNAAMMHDGAVIEVPANTAVESPIQAVYFSTGAGPVAMHPRNIVVVGESSELEVIDTFIGLNDNTECLTNTVTELFVASNAKLTRYKVVRDGNKSYHLETAHIDQERDSRYASFTINLTGQIVRNELRMRLLGENGECSLNGLYLNDGDRVVDNALNVEHVASNCRSRMAYKGILDDTSDAVFTGKVFVHQEAQKTDSDQLNQNLLLADTATIDTRPQLEIFADDVKCTHGATIGGFPNELLFYFQSRGIDAHRANGILTFGFAQEIVDEIEVEALHEALTDYIFKTYKAGG